MEMKMNREDSIPIRLGAPKCRYFHQTGAPFDSVPHLPYAPMSGILPWKWFPFKIRIRATKVLRTIAIIIPILTVAIAALARPGALASIAIVVVPNLFITYPLFYLAYIMEWNFSLREGICWCFGKSRQAKKQWVNTTNPALAKHVFFSWKNGGSMRIDVLNDGSQELWHFNGVELGDDLNRALVEGGFEGQIIDGSAVVMSNTDKDTSNMQQKPHPYDNNLGPESV